MDKTTTVFNSQQVRKAGLGVRAINHTLRQRIMHMLDEEGVMAVTAIYVRLRLDQSVVSQHLAILRRAGVVIAERNGKFINYSLDYKKIKQIKEAIEHFAGN